MIEETITRDNLVTRLQMRKGAFPVCIEARTAPTMRKTDNPFAGQVWKLTAATGFLNWSYERAVNRQLEREGEEPDFQAQPRSWGVRVKGTPFVEHKGKLYIEMKMEHVSGVAYQTELGASVDVESLRPFLSERKPTQYQGTEKEIVLRDYAMESVAALTMDGVRYVVVEAAKAKKAA